MEILGIILAISFGIGGYYSHREKKVEIASPVAEVPSYRPNVWVGEEQDEHVKDFQRIGIVPVIPPRPKLASMLWADFPLPSIDTVTETIQGMRDEAIKKAAQIKTATQTSIETVKQARAGMFTGLSYTISNSEYRHSVQSWDESIYENPQEKAAALEIKVGPVNHAGVRVPMVVKKPRKSKKSSK